MAYGRVNVSGGGGASGGGIGTTMIISQSHKGSEAPIDSPLALGYYQKIVQGDNIANVSIKKGATVVPTTKAIVDKDILQLSGFRLDYSTEYNVEVPENAMKDTLGNVLKGVFRYSFTTVGKPPVYYYYITPEISKVDFDMVIADINTNGGSIYFSEGEFRGLVPITITHSDVELIGQGKNTKIICDTPNTGTAVGIIRVEGTSSVPIERVKISSIAIEGTWTTGVTNKNYYGIVLIYTSNSDIVKCLVSNSKESGIIFEFSYNNLIKENKLRNNYYGINLRNSNRNIVTKNIIINNGYTGILMDLSSSNNIIGGNIADYNFVNGIEVANGGIFNIIKGNVTCNNSKFGISVQNSSHFNVTTGNVIINTLKAEHVIRIYNGSSYNVISGNAVGAITGKGIEVFQNSNNNMLMANVTPAMALDGVGNVNTQNVMAP